MTKVRMGTRQWFPGLNRRSRGITRAVVAAAGIVLLTMFLTGCGCLPRHPCASLLALRDLAARDGPSRLKQQTPSPEVAALQFQVGNRIHRADLYRPGDKTRAGIVLVPGAAELGKDDPRLVAFANTLARMQFAVLVPDLEQVRRFELGERDIRDLADALAFLSSHPDLAPEGRAGIAAMSYAVGPAVLAALRPEAREQARFVVGIGGYYDLTRVVAFFTTGYYRDHAGAGGPWQYLTPNEYGKWAFVLTQVDRLADPADRNIMETMARLKMEDPAAPVESLAQKLGPQGRAFFELLANRDPHRTPKLIERLPPEVKAEFNALNVSRHDLSKLQARLLLFHGRNDNIIPYTESIALARAVPPGQARLILLDGLAHVDLEGIGFRDKLRLWRGMDLLLRERSRKPPD